MALTGRTRMKRTIPFLMREGASVEEIWIMSEVVCFVMRSHGKRVQALPTASTASTMVFFGGEEDRREGRKPGLWGRGRTECVVRITFRGGVLLGGPCQPTVVWRIVACSPGEPLWRFRCRLWAP